MAGGPLNQASGSSDSSVSGAVDGSDNDTTKDDGSQVADNGAHPDSGTGSVPPPAPPPGDPGSGGGPSDSSGGNSFPGSLGGSGANNSGPEQCANGPSTPGSQIGQTCQPGSFDGVMCDVTIHIELNPKDLEHDNSCPAKVTTPKTTDSEEDIGIEDCVDTNRFGDGFKIFGKPCVHHTPLPPPNPGPKVDMTFTDPDMNPNAHINLSTYCNAGKLQWEATYNGSSWAFPYDHDAHPWGVKPINLNVKITELKNGQWVEKGNYPLEIHCQNPQ